MLLKGFQLINCFRECLKKEHWHLLCFWHEAPAVRLCLFLPCCPIFSLKTKFYIISWNFFAHKTKSNIRGGFVPFYCNPWSLTITERYKDTICMPLISALWQNINNSFKSSLMLPSVRSMSSEIITELLHHTASSKSNSCIHLHLWLTR